MTPVVSSSLSDDGSPAAEKCIGRVPVQGMRYTKGWPGLSPYTFGPWMSGTAGALGVRKSGTFSASGDLTGSPSVITKEEIPTIRLTIRNIDFPPPRNSMNGTPSCVRQTQHQ